jgi:hypothetical protein
VGIPQRALQALGDAVAVVLGQAIVEPADLVDVAVEHVHRCDGGVRVLALGIDGEHVAVGARAQLLGAPAGLALKLSIAVSTAGGRAGGLRLGLRVGGFWAGLAGPPSFSATRRARATMGAQPLPASIASSARRTK